MPGALPAGNFGLISDKVHLGYLPSYLRIAADLGPAARVLELGVYHGESLQLWQALFPFGEVTGVDSDPKSTWPTGTLSVLSDVTSPDLPELLNGPYDLIVDDSAHFGEVSSAAFALLWPLLASGGYYVVEDWYVGMPNAGPAGENLFPFYHGDSMVRMVQSLIAMLDSKQSEADEITYRYGLAVVHKRTL